MSSESFAVWQIMAHDSSRFARWTRIVRHWLESPTSPPQPPAAGMQETAALAAVLMGEMMRHNPDFSVAQQEEVRSFFVNYFHITYPAPFLDRIQECRKVSQMPALKIYCSQLKFSLLYPARLSLADFLSRSISPASQRITHQLFLLRQMAKYLGLQSGDIDRLIQKTRIGLSPFAVLGLTEQVGWEECKKAYRQKVRLEHPDRFPENLRSVQENKFKQLQWAWEAIKKRKLLP